MKQILGLDLSLTSSGVALIGDGLLSAWAYKPKGTGLSRLRQARAEFVYWAREAELVLIEGPSYGSQGGGRQSGHHERAGLWWLVYEALDKREIPVAVVPPATLKRYATGKGNASKDAMLVAAAKRFPNWEGGNDEADAAWLAAMGADRLGIPFVSMPAANREALNAVTWPEHSIRHDALNTGGTP